MLLTLAARALTRRASPTVDLYFLNACGDLVGPRRPILRRSAGVFESPRARLVIRHDVGAPPARRDLRLIYFLDDAIFAGLDDPSLPASYRAKLRLADCATAHRVLPRADALVVSTPEVAAAVPAGLLRPGTRVVTLDPYWSEPFADLGHFGRDAEVRIAFPGSGTHRAALGFLAETIARVRPEMRALRFLVSAAHRGRLPLADPRIRFVAPVSWPAYRRSLPATRWHISLYPLGPGAWAQARSANKLIEHAVLGAAPIYAAGWPRAAVAAGAGAGLALALEPALWAEAIGELAREPERARSLARGAQSLAERINRRERQREVWGRLLEVAI